MKGDDARSLSEEEKAAILKATDAALTKLEREHGGARVRWAVNRRQERRQEQARLEREKRELEQRLAEIRNAT